MALLEGIIGLIGHTAVTAGVPAAYCDFDHFGIARWEAYKEEQEERGEILDPSKLVDQDPLDERENFGAHPLLVELFDDPNPPQPAISKLDIRKIEGLGWDRERARQQSGWLAAEAMDISAAAPEGIDPRRLASHIFESLEPHRAALDAIASAAARPNCRFPIDLEKGLAAPTPHYSALKSVSRTLQLDGLASVRAQDPGRALLAATTGIRIANHLDHEHTLIGLLVQIAVRDVNNQVIWEGLRARIWDDDDLLRIDRVLGEADVGGAVSHSLRGERAIMTAGIIDIGEGRFPGGANVMGQSKVLSYLPRGLWHENARAISILFDRSFFSRPTYPGCSIPIYDEAFVEQQLHAWKAPLRPDRFLAIVAFPGLSTITTRALQAEAHIRLARTAVALECHRHRHRSYPDTLAKLVPEFLRELPTDPVTGEPLCFALRPAGTPAVWSVGINGEDDGGRPKKHSNGDWVWQYELPEGYSTADFRSNEPLK